MVVCAYAPFIDIIVCSPTPQDGQDGFDHHDLVEQYLDDIPFYYTFIDAPVAWDYLESQI